MTDQNIVAVNQIVRRVEVTTPGPAGRDGVSGGGSLANLSDTVILNPVDKDLLVYEDSSSKWKNVAIDTSYISGLGSAAVKDTGTSQSSVILGNDARLSNARTPTTTLDHDADKVTTGIFSVDRIPAISTDKLTSGTLPVGRGGTGLTSVSTLLNSNTTKSDVELSEVENTALSTWAGSGNITTVGAITGGTWGGTAIDYSALSNAPVLGTAAALDVGTNGDSAVQLTGHPAGTGALPAVSGAALTSLNAGNFTSGTLAVARGGTGSATAPMIAVVTAADAAAARGVLDAQAADADLTAIAGLTSAADKGIQFTGSGTAGVYDLTAAGKALLDDADAAAQRTTLGLGTAATTDASAYEPAGHTHTDSYAMFIVTGVDKAAPGFVLDGKVATARTITEFYTKTSGGSCTATLKNGSNEIGQIATDNTGKVDSSLTNTSVSAGDRLGVVITSNSSAVDLEIVVKYTA